MKLVRLGNTSEMVSEICLGAMYFGSKVKRETSMQLLDYYTERGGNFIDTSNNYAFWIDGCVGDESENLIGEWISERKNREKLFVATKVGARPVNKNGDFQKLAKEVIIKAVDDSLKRLKTDYIDLYYAHIDFRDVRLEETLEAFNSLSVKGKIRNIGCSNHYTWRIIQAKEISRQNQWIEYCCVENWNSYYQPRYCADMWKHIFVNDELRDYCRSQNNLTIIGYSPLLSGTYSKGTLPDTDLPGFSDRFESADNLVRLSVINDISTETGLSANQLVLAWMMQSDPRVIPIVSASKIDQLRENLDSCDVKLSAEVINRMNNIPVK